VTFYLKYRPNTINQLDLSSVREKLTAILQKKQIPHAYLFCGPKGLGKTSSARIFTKVVNCQKRDELLKKKKIEPCNKCESCLAVDNGRAIDLIEIDAASNRGIDDIRDLREKINLAPASFQYKVYVIDEVHMLTVEAFNALLKTLEEPPQHALFILCTTNPEKIPATILSRVIRVNFSLPTDKEIKRSLQRVIKGEGLKLEKGALDQMIKQSDKSFRDAHKMLEQLAFKDGEISKEAVIQLVGLSESADINEFLHFLSEKNCPAALGWIDSVYKQGVDTDYIIKEILELLRSYLLALYGVGEVEDKLFSNHELRQLIDLFSKAAQAKNHTLPTLALELAMLDYFSDKDKVQNISYNNKPDNKIESPPEPTIIGKKEKNSVKFPAKPTKKQALRLQQIIDLWPELLQKLQPVNHSIAALLRSARPSQYDENGLRIEVYYQFHKSKLESSKINQIVNQVVDELLGQKVRLFYVLGQQPAKTKTKIKTSHVFGNNEKEAKLVKIAEELFEGR
jgi:DNA polymerase-3 subunit gamma/tau